MKRLLFAFLAVVAFLAYFRLFIWLYTAGAI